MPHGLARAALQGPSTEKPFEPVRHFEHHQNFHVHVSEDEYIDDAEVGFY